MPDVPPPSDPSPAGDDPTDPTVPTPVTGPAESAEADVPPPTRAPRASGARAAMRAQLRATLLFLLGLFITLALSAVLAWAGVMLAAFGLAGVALAVSILLVLTAATLWRRALLPAAVLSCALALPAAAQALNATRLDRSIGTLVARPTSPADIPAHGYRRGAGAILVDLRQFRAANGSVTNISAADDIGQVVVALPRDRCFNLDVDVNTNPIPTMDVYGHAGLADLALQLAGIDDGGSSYPSMGLSAADQRRDQSALDTFDEEHQDRGYQLSADPLPLLAYGLAPIDAHHWSHAAPDPAAPTLHLSIRSTQQAVVRDYPDFIGPLDDYGSGLAWPLDVTPPPSPEVTNYLDGIKVRTRANRAAWVAWERRMIVWSTAQAKRFAGGCATRAELAKRVSSFSTQPEVVRDQSGHTTELLGGPTTRRSPIKQPPVSGTNRYLQVEVNGLGQVHAFAPSENAR